MSTRNSVYNRAIRIKLYEYLYEAFGAFDRNAWSITSNSDSPISVSTIETNAIYERIYHDMVFKDTIFDDNGMNPPKSPTALMNQVRWMTNIQQPHNRGVLKTQRANRLAAYEAGFVTMNDILFLEQATVMRDLIGS